MNKIMAGDYVFSISDQQAFNMRMGTLHSAHILPVNEQSEFILAKLIEANNRLTREEGHLRIQAIFSQNENYFVVYENLSKDSTNLLDLMKVKNNLPENFVRKVAQLLLAHVCKMHNLNVVHRDLKLQNIYVFKHNGQWCLKVKDLRYCEIDSKSFSNEHTGSPAYLAPEVTFSSTSYNSMKAEMYSVGVILYTLATGSYPFLGTCPKSLIQAIRSSEPSYPQHISPSLKSLLENLLSKNPNTRMQAREILQSPWVLSDAETSKTAMNTLSTQAQTQAQAMIIACSANSTTTSGSSTAAAATTTTTGALAVTPSDGQLVDQQAVPPLVQSCQASSSAGQVFFVNQAKHAAAVY